MAKFKLHKINTAPVKKHITSTTGIVFVVLGVILLAFDFITGITTNILLLLGLTFIIVGIIGYIYGIKHTS